MGVFNIDFNQFKPSTKPTVAPTPMASTPPVMKSSPAPVQQPTQMQSVPQQKTSGLQKVFNVLNAPSKFVEKTLTKGQGYEKAYTDPTTAFSKINSAASFIPRKLIPGVDKNYQASLQSDKAKKIGAGANQILLDPLNVIPFGAGSKLVSKGGKYLSKVTGAGKVAEKVTQFAKTTPKVYNIIEKVNPYFRNPEFGKVVQAAEQSTGTKINKLYRELKTMVTGISPEDQVHIGEVIEGISKPSTKKIEQIALRVKQLTKEIGQEAVDANLLTKQSFNKFTKKGYMSHIESLIPDINRVSSSVKNLPKVTAAQFKKRTGKLTEYVKEFAPVVYKGLGSEIKAIETAKMYKDIATKFGQKIGRNSKLLPGFVRASDVGIEGRAFAKAFGRVQLPEAIAEYITKVRNIKDPTTYDKMLNLWKAGKTIWNPAYHVRNEISNQILSSMGTGKNLVSTVSNYIKAVREYKAGTSSLFKTAQDIGLVGRKSFGTGLNELLDTAGLGSKAKIDGNIIKKIWGKTVEGGKLYNQKAKELQNFSEETAKLNVFKTWMEKLGKQNGLGLEDALQNKEIVKQAFDKAEEAIFSPYRISQAERSAIGSKIPFYSFTRQALPFTAKTLVDNPKSIAIFGKLKSTIESMSEDPNIELPDYMRNQIRIGAKDGKATYFDPTYIYPFGNFVESGLGRGQLPFGLSLDPFAMEVVQQLANKDLYFGNAIAKSNLTPKNVASRLAHLYRTVSPAALTTLTNTIYPALVGKKDSQGRTKNVAQAILSALGIKSSTIDTQNIEMQNLRSQKSKSSSIQQEMDQVINDPNMTRSKKDEQIQKLRSLQP